MTLRPYQTAAIESARAALTKSGSAVLQMPTGAGKTKTAVEMVREAEGGVWIVVHRREIMKQTSNALTEAGIEHGFIGAGHPVTDHAVQVAAVGSLPRRLANYPAPALVIWDECHHMAAPSWSAIHKALPDAKHLGLTATPERLDGKGLDEWFNELVCGPSIKSLTPEYLTPMHYLAPTVPDLTAAKMERGDYAKRDIAQIMGTPVLIGDAVREYKEHAPGLRAIAFCASVAASQLLVDRFNEAGVPAAHVDGATPTEGRDAAVEALAAGAIKVLSNVDVFTEGFDLPDIDAVILLRPTRSLQKFLQMVGRGLRRAVGKSRAVILDHSGLWLDHGMPDSDWAWSLAGGARDERLSEMHTEGAGARRCPECNTVRAERESECECGFVFPSGREIGEFDGVLQLVGAPEGCESLTSFARSHNSSVRTARKWLVAGLPNRSGFPLSEEGAAWLYAKNLKPCDGFETQVAFGTRIGKSHGYVHSLVKKYDLPTDDRGHVNIVPAMDWYKANRLDIEPVTAFARRMGVRAFLVADWIPDGLPLNETGRVIVKDALAWFPTSKFYPSYMAVKQQGGFETVESFAKRNGVSKNVVRAWARRGMPIFDAVRPFAVPIAEAASWAVENNAVDRSNSFAIGQISLVGYESRSAFIKRFASLDTARIKKAIKAGLPFEGGRIPIERGIAWMLENEKNPIFRTKSVAFGYLKLAEFSALVGQKRKTVSAWHYTGAGFPYDPSSGVPIQAGLEWVRDNRPYITIPPEAWPTANDNGPVVKAA